MTRIDKTLVKRGRRNHGVLFTLPDGKKIYVIRRRHKDIYRASRKTISDALREEVAGWVVDELTMIDAQINYFDFIGVHDRDTGTLYVAPFSSFTDPTQYDSCSFRNASRYLPMRFWKVHSGNVKI